MKLNGGFAATVTGIMLSSSLGGAAYMVRALNTTSERVSVVETRLDGIEKRLDSLAKKSDIRDLSIVIREALASALGEGYNRKRP